MFKKNRNSTTFLLQALCHKISIHTQKDRKRHGDLNYMKYGWEVDLDHDDIDSVLSLESEDFLDHWDRLQVVKEQVFDQADAQKAKKLNPVEKDAREGERNGF